MAADLRRWWCPACMRIHELGEVLPFKQDGAEGYTCKETGAILQPAQAPAMMSTIDSSTNDEQRYWCPGCMRSHTAEEVVPFVHGADHGLACRLTGAVVEAQDMAVPAGNGQPAASDGTMPGQVDAVPLHSNANVPTAAEVAQTTPNAPPAGNSDDRPVSLDGPADDRDAMP